jgi:hypothetical protein
MNIPKPNLISCAVRFTSYFIEPLTVIAVICIVIGIVVPALQAKGFDISHTQFALAVAVTYALWRIWKCLQPWLSTWLQEDVLARDRAFEYISELLLGHDTHMADYLSKLPNDRTRRQFQEYFRWTTMNFKPGWRDRKKLT